MENNIELGLQNCKDELQSLIAKCENNEIGVTEQDLNWLKASLKKIIRDLNTITTINLKIKGDYTLQEIADALGITRERVRQIEAQAIKKLRHPICGRILKEYASNQ